MARRKGAGAPPEVLLLEDDLDFTRNARDRLSRIVPELFGQPWDLFHGAHLLPPRDPDGLGRARA